MRTLFEIVESAKDGNMPTHEECYYAMLVYSFMFNMDHRNLREALLAEKPAPEFVRNMKAETSFTMFKTALNKSPKEYLGWNNDPANPEYQRFRKIGETILNKAVKAVETKTDI